MVLKQVLYGICCKRSGKQGHPPSTGSHHDDDNMAGPIGKEEEEEEEASTRIGENSMHRSKNICELKEPNRAEVTNPLVAQENGRASVTDGGL